MLNSFFCYERFVYTLEFITINTPPAPFKGGDVTVNIHEL